MCAFIQEATQELNRKTERNHWHFEGSSRQQLTPRARQKIVSLQSVKGGETLSMIYPPAGKPGNPGHGEVS